MASLEDVVAVQFGSPLLPGYEAGPKTAPAVILIQEWWGVTDIVKWQALKIAQRGFRVLIPDLYKGRDLPGNREEAGHEMGALDYPLAVRELAQAVQYLQETGSAKVGITGGCVGGAVAFAAAQGVPALSCAAPFYGTPNVREFQVERIQIPVQYHVGKLDMIRSFSDVPTALGVQKRMLAAGCDFELFLYDDTPHSFLNALEGVPGGIAHLEKYDYGVPPPEQVALAFERLIAFMDKHLR